MQVLRRVGILLVLAASVVLLGSSCSSGGGRSDSSAISPLPNDPSSLRDHGVAETGTAAIEAVDASPASGPLEPLPAPVASYRVQVVAPHGPIAGAEVRLNPWTIVPRGHPYEAVSDEAGWIEFAEVLPGEVSLSVESGAVRMDRISADSVAELPQTIRLPAGGWIEIALETTDRDPLPGSVHCRLVPERASRIGREHSSRVEIREGVARLGFLPVGRWRVFVWSDDHECHEEVSVRVASGKTPRVSLLLHPRPTGELAVKVTDRDGAPIPGAGVRVHGTRLDADLRTDPRGAARWTGRGSPERVEVRALRFATAEVELDPDAAGPITIALEPAAVISLEVREWDAACPSLHIAVFNRAGDSVALESIHGGSARISTLPAGTYEIRLSSEDRMIHRTITTRADEETKVEFDLP